MGQRDTAGSERGGRQRVTSRQVAAVAGVSQATVSNVINRPEIVAPETVKRVLEAIDSTGFVLSRAARALRNGHTSTIGLVVLDVANPFWGAIARGVETGASESGMTVMLFSSDESAEKERRLVRVLEEQQVSAIIISPVAADSQFLIDVQERGTAVVLVDRPHPEHILPSVSVDHVEGARLVGEHLIGKGHRRIAFVNGPHSVPWCLARSTGLRKACDDAELDPDVVISEINITAMTAAGGAKAAGDVLDLDPPVTAVFAGNDIMALGVLQGLGERGVAVPAEMSLVGYDDVNFAPMLSPPLTTVRQDAYMIGYVAARAILSRADDGEVKTVVMEPTLVERDSVGAVG